MRVLLDTNVYISFLISHSRFATTVGRIMQLAVDGTFHLVVPEEVLIELRNRISTKRYLSDRIDPQAVESIESLVRSFGDVLPPLSGDMPRITRDQNDDYLLAAAAIGDVDVLVTGDRDLLVLRGQLERPAMMSPAEFLELLDKAKRG